MSSCYFCRKRDIAESDMFTPNTCIECFGRVAGRSVQRFVRWVHAPGMTQIERLLARVERLERFREAVLRYGLPIQENYVEPPPVFLNEGIGAERT